MRVCVPSVLCFNVSPPSAPQPTSASLTRCSVKFVRKDHHKERSRIFGRIHQMRECLLRVPISSKTLGKAKVGGQYGHNGM